MYVVFTMAVSSRGRLCWSRVPRLHTNAEFLQSHKSVVSGPRHGEVHSKVRNPRVSEFPTRQIFLCQVLPVKQRLVAQPHCPLRTQAPLVSHRVGTVPSQTQVRSPLRLLLRGCGLGLGGLLLVALDHDDAEEGAHDGGGEQDEDDGDADGPDARGEEVLEGVVRVDEGLWVGGWSALATRSKMARVRGDLVWR
jgi:hypothetical protein